MEEKRVASIKGLAKVSSTLPPESFWRFMPVGEFIVDDRDTSSSIGELFYSNQLYEIGAAVQVRDWVFVLERMTPNAIKIFAPKNNPNGWVIAAFHGTEHYSFDAIEHPDEDRRNMFLLQYVVEKFWPILHPEVFEAHLKANANREDKPDLCLKFSWRRYGAPKN